MQRLTAASYLLFALLTGPALCHAERVKVEVVQTHTGVMLGASATEVADDSDPTLTRCNGISGLYSRDFGFYCGDSGVPAQLDPGVNYPDSTFFYDISVIMPNEAHLVLHCSTVLDSRCEGFPTYPESTSVVCSDFVYAGTVYKDCTATGPSANRIGVYKAAIHGDRVTIFGSNWQRHYQQYGTWQFAGAAALQDPKPSLPPEQPDPPQEAKPAPASSSAQEPKPALPQEKPDPPQETKPAPASTPAQEPQNPTSAGAGLSPSAAADQAIDPQVIEQAKAGDPVAQYKLGYHYYLGQGVPLDYVQAAIWWRKAADKGCTEAQNNLGVLYNSGKGVPQSYGEAYFWENLAAARASGPLQAQFAKNRDESGSKLWLIARLREQKRAAKWAAAHPVPPRSAEPKPDHQ